MNDPGPTTSQAPEPAAGLWPRPASGGASGARDYEDFDSLYPRWRETAPPSADSSATGKKRLSARPAEAARLEPPPASRPGSAGESPAAASAPEAARRGARRIWLELAVVAFLIASFAFTCAPALSRFVVPLGGDEVDTAWKYPWRLRQLHASPFGMEVSHFGMHNLVFWTRALPLSLSWFREHADLWMRLYCLGASCVMLAVIYGLARWALGGTYALLVTFLAAFSHYNFYLSTEAGYLNETTAAALAAVWAFLAGERAKRKWIKGILGILAALGLTLSMMLYFSGRILPVAILLYCGVRFIENRRWLRRQWPLLLGVALYAFAFGKLLHDFKANPLQASFRQKGTQLLVKPQMDWALRDYKTDSAITLAAKNIAAAFRAYARGPNTYHAYATKQAYLERWARIAAALGALWMLWRWRNPLFLLLGLIFLTHNAILGGLTMLNYPPYHQRVHTAITLCAFAAALPLWGLTRLPRHWKYPGAALAAALAFLIAWNNAGIYFHRVFSGKDRFIEDYGRCVALATFINQNIENWEIVTHNQGSPLFPFHSQMNTYNPEYRDPRFRVFEYAYWKSRRPDWRPATPARRLMFILEDPPDPKVVRELEERLPGGRWIAEPYRAKPHYRVYIPPRVAKP